MQRTGAIACSGKSCRSTMQLYGYELRRILLPKLYEKVSSAGKTPHHEANHGSIYERFAART